MRTLTYSEMEVTSGEGFFSGFCSGFTAFELIYGAGILGAVWSPPGAAAVGAALAINAACYAFS